MTETALAEPVCPTRLYERKHDENQLDTEILKVIDESLVSFGESVKQVVYFQLQTNHQVNRQDIPCRIEEFASTIEEIFGIGARLIEMKIMETLYAKTEGFLYIPKNKNLLFKDYVQSLRSFRANLTS